MRSLSRSLVLGTVAATLVLAALPAAADFSARGRQRKPARTAAPSGAAPRGAGRHRPVPAPAPSRAAATTATEGASPPPAMATPAQPAAPDAATSRSSDALIARYRGIVLSQPSAPFPLQRLTDLYRERDGKLDALIAELEQRASVTGADHYNALVALAGVYRQDAKPERAVETYERAIAERPGETSALLALAQLHADHGRPEPARELYTRALGLLKEPSAIEQTLRTLLGLALGMRDFDGAKRLHQLLVQRAQGSFFVRAELGRELLVRGEAARAEAEYRELVRAASGDNRVLAPALRDLGKALVQQGKRQEALEVLDRALRSAGQQAGLRREIFDSIAEVYRREGRVAELVGLLEKEDAHDFGRLQMLGGLYEETGRLDDALAAYQRALKVQPKDLGTRLKVVQLLQLRGDLGRAIGEYETLIAAAPHNPGYVFQLAEALLQRGDRQAALAQLEKLARRASGDDDVEAALVDFYERVGEAGKAKALLERLAQRSGGDPQHLVELGNRHFDAGDAAAAERVWRRLLLVVPNAARAHFRLGEVYLEHDLTDKAMTELDKAIELEPGQVQYRKGQALALERTGAGASRANRNASYAKALALWEELLRKSSAASPDAREARQHIVTLWGLMDELQRRARPLDRRLRQEPPDLDAGRLLAEVYVRLRQPALAEHALRLVVQRAPGDVTSLGRLEHVLVLQRKLAPAIEVLQQLAAAEPKRAREYYRRMAQYAAELYHDDEAVAYAARAVELSPEDAQGHLELGQMYRKRQHTEQAVSELRQAIAKNDRLFTAHAALAELLLEKGEVEEADKLLRRVLRSALDDELVSRAARLSVQINLGRGTLESLEAELLPIALASPQRPLYRRLLVEIYGSLAFPLVLARESGDPKTAREANAALSRIGERAVKPLLDALRDESDPQQRTAITLLAHIRNPSAGPALLAYAESGADAELRLRAVLAAGALREPALLPRLRALMGDTAALSGAETDPVAVAAAWAIARMAEPRARPLLRAMLDTEAPSLGSLGALGLALLAEGRDRDALARAAARPSASQLARAAACFGLGQLGARDSAPAVAALLGSQSAVAHATALMTLARLGAPTAPEAIAEDLVSTDPLRRKAGVAAASVLATGAYRAPEQLLPPTDQRIDAEALLGALAPGPYTNEERALALARLAEPLLHAALRAAQSSPQGALVVATALLERGGAPAFGELTRGLDDVPIAARRSAEEAARRIADAVVPAFVALARHPSAAHRSAALRLLVTRPEPEARAALTAALGDPNPDLRLAALDIAERSSDPAAATTLTLLLQHDDDWGARLRAARALGHLLARGDLALGAAERSHALGRLSQLALTDPYALVREAAVVALGELHRPASGGLVRETLERVATRDGEPRLRARARAFLEPAP